ncbi:MAG: AraC family transcriptional regulator [Bacteroidota bacterium]
MKKYDLHKNDYSKLHFEVKDLAPYVQRNLEKASVPHRHSFFQILFFPEKGKHYIDYEVIEHPKNTLFLINRNQVHHFCKGSKNEGFLFHFNDSFIAKLSLDLLSRFALTLFNEIDQPFLHLNKKEAEMIQSFSTKMPLEEEAKSENHAAILMHEFLSFLYRIERIKKNHSALNLEPDSDFLKMMQFKELIRQNFAESLSIDDYANALHLSSKKLTKISKKHYALTPAALIKSIKVLEAKRMLSNQKLSIKEVAYDLGFDQATYFTKFFKKETALTPKEFREKML